SITITIAPGTIKSIAPDTRYMTIVNRTTWGAPGEAKAVVWNREGNTISVDGKIPPGEDDYGTFAAPNPAAYFVHVFRETLEKNAVPVSGQTYPARDRNFTAAKTSILLARQPPPLSEIISVMLKVSQNLYAEMLLKSIGRAAKQQASF